MKNTIFLIVIALLLFLSIFFYWRNSKTQEELMAANDRITSLEQQLRGSAKATTPIGNPARPDSSSTTSSVPSADDKDVPPPSAAFVDELGSLSEGDIQKLQSKGLKNPEADLMNDLMRRQKSLLTASGTQGGTMAIRDIRILNDRYALAYFEDGHTGGNLLLRYAVTDGTISWTRLDSYTL